MMARTLLLFLSLSVLSTACQQGPEPWSANAGPRQAPPAKKEAPAVCAPGATQACTCTTGAAGAQSCKEGGMAWAECGCASAPTEEIRTHHLVLEDESGRTRLEIGMADGFPQLRLMYEDGKPRLGLAISAEGPIIGVFDKERKSGISLLLNGDGPSIVLLDKDQTSGVTLGITDKGPRNRLTRQSEETENHPRSRCPWSVR